MEPEGYVCGADNFKAVEECINKKKKEGFKEVGSKCIGIVDSGLLVIQLLKKD